MRALREEIVPELAWQMVRPVKFGVGELRGFRERARAMIALAETALAPVVPAEKRDFKRYIRREPMGMVLTLATWNYTYLTAEHPTVPAQVAIASFRVSGCVYEYIPGGSRDLKQ